MKRITVDGREYQIEFTIEASLYDECTVSAMEVFAKMGAAQADAQENNYEGAIKQMITSMAGVPQRALTLFYAGLLEHHGTDSGDGSVKSKADAKRILVKYLREAGKSFDDVANEMMQQMAEDNFFDLVGLNQMMERMQTEETKKQKRKKVISEVGENMSTD